MWRIIIRFSLETDKKSAVRNAIQAELAQYGNLLQGAPFENVSTGHWESPSMEPAAAVIALAGLLQILATPTEVAGSDPAVQLDHLWIYIDPTQ